MIITITSLRLRNLWQFFRLSQWGLKMYRAGKEKKGNIAMKNTGFGYMHYTISAWEDEASMKAFAYQNAPHTEAMKDSRRLATEICTYTYQGDHLPDWKTAKKLLREHGRKTVF